MFTKKSERTKNASGGQQLFLGLQAVTDCCRLDASAAVDASAHDASAPHGQWSFGFCFYFHFSFSQGLATARMFLHFLSPN